MIVIVNIALRILCMLSLVGFAPLLRSLVLQFLRIIAGVPAPIRIAREVALIYLLSSVEIGAGRLEFKASLLHTHTAAVLAIDGSRLAGGDSGLLLLRAGADCVALRIIIVCRSLHF